MMMPTQIPQSGIPASWQPSPVQPLNMLIWRAWEARGRDDDRRITVAQVNAAAWISIAALLATLVLWSRLSPYEVVARFIVSIGAVVAMMSALHTRNYMLGVVFLTLLLLFNPVIPALQFAGDWQRAVPALCMAPFALSLLRGQGKVISNA